MTTRERDKHALLTVCLQTQATHLLQVRGFCVSFCVFFLLIISRHGDSIFTKTFFRRPKVFDVAPISSMRRNEAKSASQLRFLNRSRFQNKSPDSRLSGL